VSASRAKKKIRRRIVEAAIIGRLSLFRGHGGARSRQVQFSRGEPDWEGAGGRPVF
jgi:hypothetical protein